MGCFACCFPPREEIDRSRIDDSSVAGSDAKFVAAISPTSDAEKAKKPQVHEDKNYCARSFSLHELAAATKNFKESVIGEGGFGRVYKGKLESGEDATIKQLNKEGFQGSNEFLVEVLMLSMLRHPNLVNLYGYCAEGDGGCWCTSTCRRVAWRTIYLMPLGKFRIFLKQQICSGKFGFSFLLLLSSSVVEGRVHGHLHVAAFKVLRLGWPRQLWVPDLPPDKHPLEWNTRIKIALGAANGLAYLHDVANPPVIYRDMKAANILLDDDFNPKLSDFGFAKLGPVGDKTHVSTRVMGTYGYCAPDYAMSGRLTLTSDVYSFGVLLLELLSGRRAFDCSKIGAERNLLTWAQPLLSNKRYFHLLADLLLHGNFPRRAFQHLVINTSMCLQEQPHVRPFIRDVVVALTYLATHPYVRGPDSKLNSSPSPASSPSL